MLTSFLFLVACGVVNPTPIFNSVIEKDAKAYPFVVNLDIRNTYQLPNGKIVNSPSTCTGFLITMDVVLTAAHCLDDDYGKLTIIVSAGAVDLEKGDVKRIKMLDYKKHKDYDGGDEYKKHIKNDIAIIWLEKAFVPSPKIAPVALDCGDTDYTGKVGTIIGWGDTGERGDTTTLRKGWMQVISKENCKKFTKQSPDNILCAVVGSKNQYPGRGDSGGPFIMNDAVIGINSWLPTFTKKFPKISVFVKIEKYYKFILYNVNFGPPNKPKHQAGQIQLSNICKRTPSPSRHGSPKRNN